MLTGAGGMVKAYILINVKSGKTKEVLEKIKKMKEIQKASIVSGPYDIIALAQTGNFNSLGDFVVGHIQTLEGVERTITCPVFVE